MAMARTQIYLTEEQRRQLKLLADRRRKSMAEVIREAIQEYITRQVEDLGELCRADPLRDIIGLGASGIADGSVHHDRDIYDEDQ